MIIHKTLFLSCHFLCIGYVFLNLELKSFIPLPKEAKHLSLDGSTPS